MVKTRQVKRPCARDNCRAWAMRGEAFCVAHRAGAEETEAEPEAYDARVRRLQEFAELVRAGRHDELIDEAIRVALSSLGAARSLEPEIGALRLALRRVIALDLLEGDTRDVVPTATRLVDAINRALRTQQALSSDVSDEIMEMMQRVMANRERWANYDDQ